MYSQIYFVTILLVHENLKITGYVTAGGTVPVMNPVFEREYRALQIGSDNVWMSLLSNEHSHKTACKIVMQMTTGVEK